MKMKQLTLGSLFDGSGAFPLGGVLSGIVPVWNSEIEPFPILVTHRRMPGVKHYGDVSKLSGADLPSVDIITFGSPCQDLSIAGKRAGLHDGDRSNLFFQAIRIIKEMRDATNGQYPRYCVWENVPGALSSNGGDDFRAVLEAIVSVKEEGVEVPSPENNRWAKSDVLLGDGWSLAYRVFDSQYWGVPQRRARIYLVADFAGGSAPEVLFKSEGLSGYTPQGCRPWEGTPGGAEDGFRASGGRSAAGDRTYALNPQGNSGVGVTEEKTLALVAQDHGNHPAVLQSAGFSTEHSAKARSIGYEEEMSPTLRAGVVPAALHVFSNHGMDTRFKGPLEVTEPVTATYGMGGNNQPLVVENNPTDARAKINEDGVFQTLCSRAGTGGNNTPLVAEPKVRAFGVCSKRSNSMLSDNPHSGFYEATVSRTLDQSGGNSVTSAQGGICVVAPETYSLQGSMIGRADKNGPQGDGINKDVCFTLNVTDHHCISAPAADHYCTSKNSHHTVAAHEQANTLVATDWKDPPVVNDVPNDEPIYIVRRLTPVECARLQGFPDWWCADLAVPDPTDEELAFWTEVWETWRQVTNPKGKPKTEKQIRKWLADPYTDSAEYKLWGNGLHLGIAYFVLAGIAWAADKDKNAQL